MYWGLMDVERRLVNLITRLVQGGGVIGTLVGLSLSNKNILG